MDAKQKQQSINQELESDSRDFIGDEFHDWCNTNMRWKQNLVNEIVVRNLKDAERYEEE